MKDTLETDRLIVREAVENDRECLGSVFGDPEVMRFGAGTLDDDAIRGWIIRQQVSYAARSYGLWVVCLKPDRRVIGYAGLTFMPALAGRDEVELGYRLNRSSWGKGYATEAAIAIRDHAFRSLRVVRLISLIDPQNVRSQRVARKVGMRVVGEVMLDGYTHPDLIFARNIPHSGGF